jgi:hypothetical protein
MASTNLGVHSVSLGARRAVVEDVYEIIPDSPSTNADRHRDEATIQGPSEISPIRGYDFAMLVAGSESTAVGARTHDIVSRRDDAVVIK